MNHAPLAYIGIIIVVLAVTASLAMIVVAQAIRGLDSMDLEATAWACFAMTIIGTAIGWAAFGHPVGKVAAVIGTLAVLGFIFLLMSTSRPVDAPIRVPTPPVTQQGHSGETS